MTSSLVGSEMCIRDSLQPRAYEYFDFVVTEMSLPERDVGQGMAELHKAVSYTHLTLPTICSV
eukprot:568974-Prorocentrum_lima.AAC.1